MLANAPRVSVVMPVFNCAAYLADAIASVQGQTFKDWELIIVDDASTDASADIAKQVTLSDSRIRFYPLATNSHGAAHPRNIALDSAAGRYVAFLDADDIWLPAKLEKQIRFMKDTNAAFSYTAFRCMNPDGLSFGRAFAAAPVTTLATYFHETNIGLSTGVVDTSITGPFAFDEKAPVEDFDLWVRLLKKHDGRGLNEELMHYRRGHASLSSGMKRMAVNKLRSSWYLRHELGTMRATAAFTDYLGGFAQRKAERFLQRLFA